MAETDLRVGMSGWFPGTDEATNKGGSMVDPETLEAHQVIKFTQIDGSTTYGVVTSTNDLFREVMVRSMEHAIRIHWDDLRWKKAEHVGPWSAVSREIADQCFTGREIKTAMGRTKNRKQRRQG